MIPSLHWRTDEYGRERQALYIGKINVGHIALITGTNGPRWRGWWSKDESGDQTGWFDTADDARESVEQVVAKALSD